MAFMAAKNIAMAVGTMRASRSRTILTMLGVIIAVAAITTIVSIGNGLKQSAVQQTNHYSQNVVTVRPSRLDPSAGNGSLAHLSSSAVTGMLTNDDATAIAKVPHIDASVPLTIVGSSAQGDNKFNGVVLAASSDLSSVVNQNLAYGGFFTSKDDSNNVAVLGWNAAQRMFNQDVPLGRSFSINGQDFIVDGILNSFGSMPLTGDINFDNAIFVPNGQASSLSPNSAPIYEILAKVSAGHSVDGAAKAITSTMVKNHGGNGGFSVLTPQQLAQQQTSAFGLLAELTVAAAAITLLVSGIGIMNVMLVSVTERVHEIGIRKAVGATNRQILTQFLTEAATLSVVGSLIGAIIAFFAAITIHLTTSLTPQYPWKIAIWSCVVACAFGVFFGSIPAIKAARKDPIAALRNE